MCRDASDDLLGRVLQGHRVHEHARDPGLGRSWVEHGLGPGSGFGAVEARWIGCCDADRGLGAAEPVALVGPYIGEQTLTISVTRDVQRVQVAPSPARDADWRRLWW